MSSQECERLPDLASLHHEANEMMKDIVLIARQVTNDEQRFNAVSALAACGNLLVALAWMQGDYSTSHLVRSFDENALSIYGRTMESIINREADKQNGG